MDRYNQSCLSDQHAKWQASRLALKNTNTSQPNFSTPAMFKGTINSYRFTPQSDLDLSRGVKRSGQSKICWLHFLAYFSMYQDKKNRWGVEVTKSEHAHIIFE